MKSFSTRSVVLPLAAAALIVTLGLVRQSAWMKNSLRLDALQPPGDLNPSTAKPVQDFGNLPLSFEANHGQTDKQVNFLARGNGYGLFLCPQAAVLKFADVKRASPLTPLAVDQSNDAGAAVLRMTLIGARRNPPASGETRQPGKSNYLLGKTRQAWITDVPHYAQVRYTSIYPGIDLIYYGNQRQLEYDFIVAPGVNPQTIMLAFEGANEIGINAQGELTMKVSGRALRQPKPFIYQEVDGMKREIAGGFVLMAENRVGFQVGDYDHSQPLIIDPTLVYSTFLGGNGEEIGNGITVDASGSAYVTGRTASLNFPITSGALQTGSGGAPFDAFVTKLSPAGDTLIYSTYLGGNNFDEGMDIAVDATGQAYVTGNTKSTNFPTTTGVLQTVFNGGANFGDGFVAKLNSTGNALVYATYLGGANDDRAWAVALDSSGNAYLTGETRSSNFPLVNQLQNYPGDFNNNGFVTKLNPNGSALAYSTYLGGNSYDQGTDLVVDLSGKVYVTGMTQSTTFPTLNAFQASLGSAFLDAFVTKLDTNLSGASSLIYSTYLGGNLEEQGSGIAVNASGNALVTGQTASANFVTTAGALQTVYGGGFYDGFVTMMSASGNALVYSTYLGGNAQDEGEDIALDASDNAYIVGFTHSSDFPTVLPFQAANGGAPDAFISKLNPSGSALVYSSFLGGSSTEVGQGIALDNTNSVYLTGYTLSGNYPTVNPVQAARGGSIDAFVAKVAEVLCPANLSIAGSVPDFCEDQSQFINLTVTGDNLSDATFNWSLSGTTPSPSLGTNANLSITLMGLAAGNYTITGTVNKSGCSLASVSQNFTVQAAVALPNAGPDQVFCEATSTTLAATPPTVGTGMWTVVDGPGIIADPFNPNTLVTNLSYSSNAFRWTVTNGLCSNSDIVAIIRHQTPTTADAGLDQSFCETSTATLTGNTPTAGVGEWGLVSGSATITDPSSPATTVTGLGYGANLFQWRISNGSCGVSIDYVLITRYQTPTTANAGADQIACEAPGATMAANAAIVGTGTWTLVSGSGTIDEPHNPTTVMSNLGYGDNVFRWTIANGDCGSSSDEVIITRNRAPSISGQPVSLTNVCSGTSVNFSVTASGTGLTYQWRKNGLNLTDGSNLSGVTTATLTLSAISNGNAGAYDVVVTGACSPPVTSNIATLSLDTTLPIMTCPMNITKTTDVGQCSAVTTYALPAVSDNCSDLGAPICIPPSGSAFPKGTTTVTCSVTDSAGNTAMCSFSVIVIDTQPPSINCPANITASAAINQRSTVVNYALPNVTDNCAVASVVCSPPSGATFSLGVTTVACVATDGTGNQANCAFAVAVSGMLLADADSFLRNGSDNTNEGANERLRIQSSGNNRAVVRFDLSDIPTTGLQSATLVLNIAENSDNWGANGRLVDAHRLLVEWAEGNGRNDVMAGGGTSVRGSGEGVTWNCAEDTDIHNHNDDCASPWNGGTYAPATASANLHINNQTGEVTWNVTADILAGAGNGWLIKKQVESQNGQVRYYSREGAALTGNSTLAPRLILVYMP
ncbi:MAG: SBBP repeat-containing protein [Acidobacteriota bacterium]